VKKLGFETAEDERKAGSEKFRVLAKEMNVSC